MILCRAAGRSRAAGAADTVPLNAQWLTNSTFSPPKCGYTFSATTRVTIAHKTKFHGHSLVPLDDSSSLISYRIGGGHAEPHHSVRRITVPHLRVDGQGSYSSNPLLPEVRQVSAQHQLSISRRYEPVLDQLRRQLGFDSAVPKSPSSREGDADSAAAEAEPWREAGAAYIPHTVHKLQ